MAEYTDQIVAFISGEISEDIRARYTSDFYFTSCRKIENMFVLKEGPATKRGGTKFITSLEGYTRLVPFQFSEEQRFVLLFGDKKMKVVYEDGVILDTRNRMKEAFTGTVSDGEDGVLTYSGTIKKTDKDNLKADESYQVVWEQVEHSSSVTVKTDDGTVVASGSSSPLLFTLPSSFSSVSLEFTASQADTKIKNVEVKAPDGKEYEIESPYSLSLLEGLQWQQSNDVVFLVHPSLPPQQLVRYANNEWKFEKYSFEDGPYQRGNSDVKQTLAPSSVSGIVTITAAGFSPFTKTDVGRHIKIRTGDPKATDKNLLPTWGWGVVTEYVSPTSVKFEVRTPFKKAMASSDWYMGSWSDTTGWPKAITIYEERLIFGGNKATPNTFWGSEIGDYYKFSPFDDGVEDPLNAGQIVPTSGFTLTLGGAKVSNIQWVGGGQSLVIGTDGGLFRAVSSQNKAFSPENAALRSDSGVDTKAIQPKLVDNRLVFAQKQGKKMYGTVYDFGSDSLASAELTVFASHILQSPVKDFVYQQEPYNSLWCLREDGTLAVCTYNPAQEALAWSNVVVGGNYKGKHAQVLSIATVSGQGEDLLYLVVKRTIKGKDSITLERLTAPRYTREEAYYVDSGLCYNSPYEIEDVTQEGNDVKIVLSQPHPLSTGDGVVFYRLIGAENLMERPREVEVVDNVSFLVKNFSLSSPYVSGGVIRKQVTKIVGLDHLEGETVRMSVDGAATADAVVENGEIELKSPAAIVCVGLPYTATLVPRRVVPNTAQGYLVMNKKRVKRAYVGVIDSMGLRYGSSGGKGQPPVLNDYTFRLGNDRMDTALPYYTGELIVSPPSNYALDEWFYLMNDSPLPFKVTNIILSVDTGNMA